MLFLTFLLVFHLIIRLAICCILFKCTHFFKPLSSIFFIYFQIQSFLMTFIVMRVCFLFYFGCPEYCAALESSCHKTDSVKIRFPFFRATVWHIQMVCSHPHSATYWLCDVRHCIQYF